MQIHVINLRRSVERRQRIEARLTELGLPFSIFEAIDGSAGAHEAFANYDDAACLRQWRKTLSHGEIACFASHYVLWQRCRDSGRPMLVLEDDASFAPHFLKAYQALPELLERFGYVRMHGFKPRRMRRLRSVPMPDGLSLVRFPKGPLGTTAYAITPEAAAILIENAATWTEPVDSYVDHFWRHGLRCVAIAPYPVKVERSPTTLGERGPVAVGAMKIRKMLRKLTDNIRRIAWNGTHPGPGRAAVAPASAARGRNMAEADGNG